MKKLYKTILSCAVALAATTAWADGLAPLHVDGRHVVDASGKAVTLHGVMDTPNRYFNNWRWQSWKATYGQEDVKPCLNYFEKVFTALTDTAQGAYCDVFRLHLDPCWTNDPNKTQTGSETGEANISQFSMARYKSFLTSLYIPLIEKALAHGLYVVVRPPGVCPKSLSVGDEYNQYLVQVWGEFASRDFVKLHAGQVSIELANEPVSVSPKTGFNTSTALHDYFQPVVDTIRAAGFTGIIWVPGSAYQAQYQDYAYHPVEDDNYGYAVHCYPGWYSSGSNDNDYTDAATMAQSFTNQVPVVKTKPVIVTEIDWSPYKPGTGHTDEHGNTVLSNYGTWGTATTSHFGNAFKRIHDYYGNVGMVLEGSGLYLDIDEYLKSNTVQPAFKGVGEACGEACFKWYKEWWDDKANDDETKPYDIVPDTTTPTEYELEDCNTDWTATYVYGLWASDNTRPNLKTTFENGLVARNDTAAANYMFQYQCAANLKLKAGAAYTLKMTLRGSSDGTMHVAVGDWGNFAEDDIHFDANERTYTIHFTATTDGGFVLCQTGAFVGTTYIKSVVITHEEQPYDGNIFLRFTSTAATNAWDRQAYYDLPTPLETGTTYTLTMKVRGSNAYNDLGFWPIWTGSDNRNQWGGSNDVQYEAAKSFTASWTTLTWHFTARFPIDRLQFCFGKYGGTLDFDDIVLVKDGTDDNLVANGSFAIASFKGWSHNQNGPSMQMVKIPSSSTGIGVATAPRSPSKATAYNLAGQPVGDSYKGIVIVGGKKVIRR